MRLSFLLFIALSLAGMQTSIAACVPDGNGDVLLAAFSSCSWTSATVPLGIRVLDIAGTVTLNGAMVACETLVLRKTGRINLVMTGAVNVSGDAVMETGSYVDGFGQGYAILSGPGALVNIRSVQHGGAHAGCSGTGRCTPSLAAGASSTIAYAAYGDFRAPTSPGSGGTTGSGGAAFRLIVGGTLTLNCSVNVGGGPAAGQSYTRTGDNVIIYPSGGSGGSIYVTCGTLAPSSGTLGADGGGCSTPYCYYGGSAGRIAISCNRHSFATNALADYTLAVTAVGGTSKLIGTTPAGAPGTIWLDMGAHLATDARASPILLVRGRGNAAQPALVIWTAAQTALDLQSVQIVLQQGATLQLTRDVSFPADRIANVTLPAPTGDGTGFMDVPARVAISMVAAPGTPAGVAELRGATLRLLVGSVPLLPSVLTLAAGGTLQAFGTVLNVFATALEAGGTLALMDGAVLACAALTARSGSRLAVGMTATANVTGNAIFEAGSYVDGVGTGYAAGVGPGAPVIGTASGGAHAGCGVFGGCLVSLSAADSSVQSNAVYGTYAAPVAPGSGGGNAGSGGAALRMNVGGVLSLNGTVNVSGQLGTLRIGGSGGSLYITCGTLAPSSGSLVADAGDSASGGRIAIVCSRHSFRGGTLADVTLRLSAAGGSNGTHAGAPGTIYLSIDASTTGPLGRMRALLVRSAAAGLQAQPAVLIAGGSVRLDELRLEGGAALLLAPPESASGALLLTVGALFTDGTAPAGVPPSIAVAPNASLLLYGQQLALGSTGSDGVLSPSSVAVTAGAERVTAVLAAATVLSSAEVVLSDPGCLSPDACTSRIGSLRVTGSGLSYASRAANLVQRWTTARELRITSCSDGEVVVQYDFSADPRPWLFYEANITLVVAQSGTSSLVTNAVPVRLPGRPRIAGPATARWSDTLQVNGTLIREALRGPGATLTVEAQAADSNSTVALPVPLASELGTSSNDDSILLLLRFVASVWRTSAPASLAGNAVWEAQLVATFISQAGRADAGAVRRFVLLPKLLISVVEPESVNLTSLLPQAGGASSLGTVLLPASPWSETEAAAVCPAAACAVAVGPFVAAQAKCFNSSARSPLMQLQLPAGFGAGHPVMLTLCGGLLNVSLGTASYAPSGIRAVWPAVLPLRPSDVSPNVTFYFPIVGAQDAAWYTDFTIGSAPCSAGKPVGPWAPPDGAQDGIVTAAALSSAGGAIIACNATTASLDASVGPEGAAALAVSLIWGGATVAAPGMSVLVVARPRLSSLIPAVLTPGGAAVLSGAHFCKGDWRGGCFRSRAASTDLGTPPGTPPVQLWLEPAQHRGTNASFRFPCADMRVLTDEVATCTPPSLALNLPGYPDFTATLTSIAGVQAPGRLNATYPSSSGSVRFVAAQGADSTLPSLFVPSDAGAPWLLPEIAVEVVLASSGLPFAGALECSLVSRTPGVLLMPEKPDVDLSRTGSSSGRVSFGRIGIRAPFTTPSVLLVASCNAPLAGNVTGISSRELELRPHPLNMTLCDPLPAAVQSLAVLPPRRVAVTLGNASTVGANATGTDSSSSSAAHVLAPAEKPECAANRTFRAFFSLPAISCIVSAASFNGTEAVLQGSSAEVNQDSGTATFASLSIGGRIGSTFAVSLRCAVGSVVLPGALTTNVTLTGCAPGLEPVDPLCAPCGDGRWSSGGLDTCHGCPPRGAVCSGGLLQLLPGYYLPPGRAHEPFDERAQLYECLFPERCLVNMSAALSAAAAAPVMNGSSIASYRCSEGSTGPLCALCDIEAGYAAVNGACEPCPAAPLGKGVIAAFVLVFIAAVAYIVLRKPADAAAQAAAAAESIALRILLTHVQALAALRAFRASGLTLFRAVTAWTDAMTPAALTEGPSSCVLKPSFAATFLGTLALPLIASGLGLVILAAATVCCRRSAAPPPAEADPPDGKPLPHTNAPVEARRPTGKARGWSGCKAQLQMLWRSREAERVLVVVLSIAYMSVVSACVSALDCSEPVDGVRYLRSDYRVECRGAAYAGMAAVAVIALLVVGAGFPLLIFMRLRRVTAHALHQRRFAAWSFLFQGYRVPASAAVSAHGVLSHLGRSPALAEGADGAGDDDACIIMTANPAAASRAGAPASSPPAAVAAAAATPSQPAISQSRWVTVMPASSSASAFSSVARCCSLTRLRSCGSNSRRRKLAADGPTHIPSPTVKPDAAAKVGGGAGRLGGHSPGPGCVISPGNRAFWEATVLLRKLCVVLLARLVVEPLVQISTFVSVMVLFLTAHMQWQPYKEARFALAETVSLLCLITTASLAIDAQPAARASVDAVAGVNGVIVLVNAATLAFLLWTWLRLCAPRKISAARGVLRTSGQWVSSKKEGNAPTASASAETATGIAAPRRLSTVAANGGAANPLRGQRKRSSAPSPGTLSPLVLHARTAVQDRSAAPAASVIMSDAELSHGHDSRSLIRRSSHAPARIHAR